MSQGYRHSGRLPLDWVFYAVDDDLALVVCVWEHIAAALNLRPAAVAGRGRI